MKARARLIACALLLGSLAWSRPSGAEERDAPFNGRGERVGEVTSTSAIVHTHLTATPELVGSGKNRRFQSVPGYARMEYATQPDFSQSKKTEWKEARWEDDCCVQFQLTRLQPDTRYHYRIHTADPSRKWTRVCTPGSFRTAPAPEVEAEISFVAITGQNYHRRRQPPRVIEAYDGMLKARPDFYVSTGDNVYYDKNDPRVQRKGTASETLATARLHWQRMFGWPNLKAFFARVPGYWMVDDHDYRFNDSDPHVDRNDHPTPEEGEKLFREQLPMSAKTYRAFRWGKCLEIILTEGRMLRSPNLMLDGPLKSLWGKEQKAWLKETLLSSGARFKVLFASTPMVGPSRSEGRNDAHCDRLGFYYEGREFFNWLRENNIRNLFIICGDLHSQQHSVDETGYHEFACGAVSSTPLSGEQAKPWKVPHGKCVYRRNENGFLWVVCNRQEIQLRFCDVKGNLVNTYKQAYHE